MKYKFTSESVTMGHPDKFADQISDAVLDTIISQDPDCRVACETMVASDVIVVSGEISTSANYDIDEIVHRVAARVGYDTDESGFNVSKCKIIKSIREQSTDISIGINREGEKNQGAGDQGIMFGYACSEYCNLMPYPIEFANLLTMHMTAVRKLEILPYLRPDGKSQVTVCYDGDDIVIDTIVISSQHKDGINMSEMSEDIEREIIRPAIDEGYLKNTKILINPTGRFVSGGPAADVGLTGRKIIVDTYGGAARHGGGAFSGKDPSKVDRSASYYARYVAKNIVSNNLSKKCEIQISYAIGVPDPVSIYIDTFGTEKVAIDDIYDFIKSNFDFSPYNIISELNLKRPIYQNTSINGHFGKPYFSWERIKNDIC